MGGFKPLLPLAGSTALERCIRSFRTAGVAEVIAVLGHRADEVRPLAERWGARCVLNPLFDRGMYSSIVIGCQALPEWAEAAFVLPVDIPLIRPATIRQLAETRASLSGAIVYPVFGGHRGHPPLIGRQILAETAPGGAEGPLSALLMRHERSSIEVPVADEAIHMDMDTPTDYDILVSLAARHDIPSGAECAEILAGQHVTQPVIRHSRMVANIALRLAHALHRTGMRLNMDLVQAGALLHDLAKGRPDHAVLGASILRAMDFLRVAEIVGAHTDLQFSRSTLDERAIVYLADKLVRGEDLVTITQRFQPALDRFGGDPIALHAARRRMETAKEVACAVETRLGASLGSVLNDYVDSSMQQFEISTAHEAMQS